MPLPQVNDRLKEIPAQALRTVFATVGQLLLVADRLRMRTGEQHPDNGEASAAPASEQAPAPVPVPRAKPARSRAARSQDAESSRWRSLDKTGNVRLLEGDEEQDEEEALILATSSVSEPAIAEPAIAEPSVPEPVADATPEPVPGPAGLAPADPDPAGLAPADPDPAGLAPADPDPAGLTPPDPDPAGLAPAETAASAATATAGEALPVPHYDQLSVASLRARLRVLDADQVQMLLDYEKAREGRPAVITMFERRLTKLSEGS